ncbi:MAG: ribonuclease H family protein [Pseudomonadales bacterium]
MAKKFYVVWQGHIPGIYTDWPSCQAQTNGYKGAKFKSFPTNEQAEAAFGNGPAIGSTEKRVKQTVKTDKSAIPSPHISVLAAVKIYTDGACDPNPGKAGSGMAIYRDEVLAELWYGIYNPAGTNNTAELNALYQAMLYAQSELSKGLSVAIFCDSMYSIQCITEWAEGWEKKGWKRRAGKSKDNTIKNLELIKEMYALYQSLPKSLQIKHVKAHAGIEGNELADRMSMLAIDMREAEFSLYREEINIPELLSMRSG